MCSIGEWLHLDPLFHLFHDRVWCFLTFFFLLIFEFHRAQVNARFLAVVEAMQQWEGED